MKKAIVILTLFILVCGSVFAASGDMLLLKTRVKPVNPVFEIYSSTTKGSPDPGTTVDKTTLDPADEDITLQIQIKQTGEGKDYSRKKDTKGYELTITATALVNSEESSYKTEVPSVLGVVSLTTDADCKVEENGTSANEVKLKVTYPTGKKVNTRGIASWTYKWTKVEDLPDGDYNATITLTFTAVT